MAFKRKTYKGICDDTDEHFVCDTAADIDNLPVTSPQGSTAFVIEDSTLWMINSQGEWIEINKYPVGISPFMTAAGR